jgi:hypothetical protein
MSVRTRLQAILVETPNLFTGSMHIGFAGLAAVSALIPKVGQQAHEFFTKIGDQYTTDSEARELKQRARLLELTEMDKRAAEKAAEVAEAAAPLIQAEASELSKKRVIENKGQSDLRVLQGQEKGQFKVTQEEEKLRIKTTHTDTTHQLKQQAIAHRTEDFSHLKKHLDTMTELTGALTQASTEATSSAKDNIGATEASYKSILGLNKAIGEVIEANSELHKALADYDYIVEAGEMDAGKAQAISQALIAGMVAEKKVEAVIATTSIEHRSELKQAFMQDVAVRNTQLDDSLHDFSKQTLEKLSELIQAEITTSQEQINSLTEDSDIETIQPDLDKLLAMRDKVQAIALTKPDANPGATMDM